MLNALVSTKPKVGWDQVQALRDLLLGEVSNPASGKIVRRQVVEQVFPLISQLRSLGYDFDELSAFFDKAGISIAAETIKSYYYDLSRVAENRELQEQIREDLRNVGMAICNQFNRAMPGIVRQQLENSTKEVVATEMSSAVEKLSDTIKNTPPIIALPPQAEAAEGDKVSGQKKAGGKKSKKASGENNVESPPDTPLPSVEEIKKMLKTTVDLSLIASKPLPGK